MPFDRASIQGHLIPYRHKAKAIRYNNSTSGLTAKNVQDALDEIDSNATFDVFTATWTDTLTAAQTLIKQIALGASDYTHGYAVVKNGNNTSSDFKHAGGVITFTTTESESAGAIPEVKSQSIPSYPSGFPYYVRQLRGKAWIYANDSVISPALWDNTSGATRLVRINYAKINGSNLDVAFQNLSGSSSRPINVEIIAYVFKDTAA